MHAFFVPNKISTNAYELDLVSDMATGPISTVKDFTYFH